MSELEFAKTNPVKTRRLAEKIGRLVIKQNEPDAVAASAPPHPSALGQKVQKNDRRLWQ